MNCFRSGWRASRARGFKATKLDFMMSLAGSSFSSEIYNTNVHGGVGVDLLFRFFQRGGFGSFFSFCTEKLIGHRIVLFHERTRDFSFSFETRYVTLLIFIQNKFDLFSFRIFSFFSFFFLLRAVVQTVHF